MIAIHRPKYRCAACDLGVIILPPNGGDGEPQIIRGCKCTGGIVADMSATVVARGGVEQKARLPRLSTAFTVVDGVDGVDGGAPASPAPTPAPSPKQA